MAGRVSLGPIPWTLNLDRGLALPMGPRLRAGSVSAAPGAHHERSIACDVLLSILAKPLAFRKLGLASRGQREQAPCQPPTKAQLAVDHAGFKGLSNSPTGGGHTSLLMGRVENVFPL